jgi:head-tail adaptor
MKIGSYIHIGLLNTYLQLEVATSVVGSMGGTSDTWAVEANIWADLRATTGQTEKYEAEQKVSINKSEAVIYSRAIRPGRHRLKSGADVYDIIGVQPVEQRESSPGAPFYIKLFLEKKDNSNG